MTPEDRRAAREALESGRLKIEEVTALREACERTGRSFHDLASERHPGLLPPPAPGRRNPYPLLLVGSAAVIIGLFIATLSGMISEYLNRGDQAETSMNSVNEAEQLGRRTRQEYERRQVRDREAAAAESLRKAREAMGAVEKGGPDAAHDPQLYILLVEARTAYDAYLEVHSGDAAVHAERARTWELLGNPKRELEDLERAVELDPGRDAQLGDRIASLRLRLSR